VRNSLMTTVEDTAPDGGGVMDKAQQSVTQAGSKEKRRCGMVHSLYHRTCTESPHLVRRVLKYTAISLGRVSHHKGAGRREAVAEGPRGGSYFREFPSAVSPDSRLRDRETRCWKPSCSCEDQSLPPLTEEGDSRVARADGTAGSSRAFSGFPRFSPLLNFRDYRGRAFTRPFRPAGRGEMQFSVGLWTTAGAVGCDERRRLSRSYTTPA